MPGPWSQVAEQRAISASAKFPAPISPAYSCICWIDLWQHSHRTCSQPLERFLLCWPCFHRPTRSTRYQDLRTRYVDFAQLEGRSPVDGWYPKVAIVTGVSSGIGRAVCASFLASGVKVLGVDIKAAPYDINDDNFSFLQIDLIRPDSSDLVARACNDKFGERIDILVNNAGIMDNSASADTLDDETWERNIEINLTSPVKLMRAVLPSMKAQGYGSIVNVSTKAGNSGAVSGIAYSAAKHGLHGATKNVAWRFRDDGIRCNCIAPGGTYCTLWTQ